MRSNYRCLLAAVNDVPEFFRIFVDETPADELIRQRDLPKLPIYLPRPLEPEADRVLRAPR